MGNAAIARPARFEQASQRRRAMIAKIKIAQVQLQMEEDAYRQIVFEETGKLSLTECNDMQLARVIDAMKAKGFRPLPRKAGKPGAQHKMARKARALWISLYHLGVVHNAGEPAFEAFAKRQLGCDRLAWANQGQADKLIEALKGMALRNGWKQTDHKGSALGPLGLQASLCEAILARLKAERIAHEDWIIDHAAYRLCGIELAGERPVSAEQYASLAANLGAKLREAKGGVA